jgi:hypothetical protein
MEEREAADVIKSVAEHLAQTFAPNLGGRGGIRQDLTQEC